VKLSKSTNVALKHKPTLAISSYVQSFPLLNYYWELLVLRKVRKSDNLQQPSAASGGLKILVALIIS